MEEQNVCTITADELRAEGYTEPKGEDRNWRKVIMGDDEDGEVALICHQMYGSPMFAINFPDGTLLHLNPSNIEDMRTIERLIYSYDPPY